MDIVKFMTAHLENQATIISLLKGGAGAAASTDKPAAAAKGKAAAAKAPKVTKTQATAAVNKIKDTLGAPAQDEEFVLMHADNVQATGFLEHIKLPHYVDFQSELELIRKLRRAAQDGASEDAPSREAAE